MAAAPSHKLRYESFNLCRLFLIISSRHDRQRLQSSSRKCINIASRYVSAQSPLPNECFGMGAESISPSRRMDAKITVKGKREIHYISLNKELIVWGYPQMRAETKKKKNSWHSYGIARIYRFLSHLLHIYTQAVTIKAWFSSTVQLHFLGNIAV